MLYSVYSGLFDFADQKGSEYLKFNTPDNLDFSKSLIVMDTLGLRGKILDIVTVSLAFRVKSNFWKVGIAKRKSLDIDEGWNFKNKPLVIKILEDNARTFRKSKSGQAFITQGIEDAAENSSIKALFTSSYHKFLLAQDNKEIQKVSKSSFFPLSAYEERLFTSVENKKPHWGEAMYISKKTGSNAFIIKTSPKVHWLCAGADPDGNTLFDETQKKYSLTSIETIRFLALKDVNRNYSDNDLLHLAKNYSEQSNLNQEEEKRYWKEELNSALKEKRFQVKAEPICDLKNGDIVSFETFLQLRHHDNTISSFPRFIKYAQEFKLEEQIFEIMLNKIFGYFEESDYKFHLNLNTDEIRNFNLMTILKEQIERYDIKNKLVLELKETDTNKNIDELKAFIDELHQKNVFIALDNIGLHYHKMAYIVMLEVDYIKVEGELIFDANEHDGAKRALELITALCKTTKNSKKVIATKVENTEELKFLNEMGFDLYQGYINKKLTRYF